VELAEETDEHGQRLARTVFALSDSDKRLKRHALDYMEQMLEAAGGRDIFRAESTAHLMGGCRMGSRADDSVTDANGRSWQIANLWICDGSLMPTGGGVNPALTIMANAARIADRIGELARRGEL
ncbi:MAG TPA: GMC family oxidoreductase, partial [Polyangiales bacterium]|nr:GMC family oxidoreductase [Polyangiales bacterium]